MNDLCCFNLAFGAAFENAVTTALIEHEPPLPGFTLFRAAGHGSDFAQASVEERVRGSVERRILSMVLPRASVAEVIATLSAQVRSEHVAWWTVPVEQFGRLA